MSFICFFLLLFDVATRKSEYTKVAHMICLLGSVKTDQGAQGPARQLPSSRLHGVGDLWVERGSEVVERDKVSSFPAGGCRKKPTFTARFWASLRPFCGGLFPLRSQAAFASRRGEKRPCQQPPAQSWLS